MNVALAADDIDAAAVEVIERICAATEPEVRALLPMLNDELTLTVSRRDWVIPETGETGAAMAVDAVEWWVRPDGDVAAIAEQYLRFTLFHELHHVARGWLITGEPATRFVHAAISEGMATAFERDAAGSAPLWGDYPDDVDAWVEELLAMTTWPSYPEWMFQHPDGRRWIGYRAGTYIVDRAMQATGRSAAELVNVSGDEVLALAGW